MSVESSDTVWIFDKFNHFSSTDSITSSFYQSFYIRYTALSMRSTLLLLFQHLNDYRFFVICILWFHFLFIFLSPIFVPFLLDYFVSIFVSRYVLALFSWFPPPTAPTVLFFVRGSSVRLTVCFVPFPLSLRVVGRFSIICARWQCVGRWLFGSRCDDDKLAMTKGLRSKIYEIFIVEESSASTFVACKYHAAWRGTEGTCFHFAFGFDYDFAVCRNAVVYGAVWSIICIADRKSVYVMNEVYWL